MQTFRPARVAPSHTAMSVAVCLWTAFCPAATSPAATDGDITSAVVQPDGKVIVSGGFTQFESTPVPDIIRLKADGTLDDTFQLYPNATQAGLNLQLQPDGEVLVFGADSEIFGGIPKDIVRLNTDGSLDTGFTASPDLDGQGIGLATVSPDGKLLVDTGFDHYGGAATGTYHLTRLAADGSEDAGFQTSTFGNPALGYPFGARLLAVAVQADGRILVAGNFSEVNATARTGVARLNADGSLDGSFVPVLESASSDGMGFAGISAVFPRADGTILISGSFTTVNGVARAGFAAINADGTLNGGFTPDAGLSGRKGVLAGLGGDGKIFVTQSDVSPDGAPLLRLLRLNADGSLDAAFAPATMTKTIGADTPDSLNLYAVRALDDGRIVLAGNFAAVNQLALGPVAVLNPDGTVNLGSAQSVVEVEAVGGGFEVTRTSGDDSRLVRVRYTIKGSAAPGTDYRALSGTVRLGAGKKSKTIRVRPLSGAAGGKTVKLIFSVGDGYTAGKSHKAKFRLPAGS